MKLHHIISKLSQIVPMVIGITVLVFMPVFATAQSEDMDNLFLDESINQDSVQQNGDTPNEKSANKSADAADTIGPPDMVILLKTRAPTFSLFFDLKNRYTHALYQRDSTALNPDRLLYVSPLQNLLTLAAGLRYINAARWFNFEVRNRAFFALGDKDNKSKPTDIATVLRNELISASASVRALNNLLSFRVGKILDTAAVGFMRSPSDPLHRVYGSEVAWASNRKLDTFSTRDLADGADVPEREWGSGVSSMREESSSSGTRVGSWMLDTTLLLPWFTLRQAYLPKLETGFEEFDRPHHSFLTSVSLTLTPVVTPTFTFFYDNNPFVGFAVSGNVGDTVTLYFDSSVTFENNLPIVRKDGAQPLSPTASLRHFKLEKYNPSGAYFEGVGGVVYTPTLQGEALFSIMFELYYNGHGLLNDEWDTYVDSLKNVKLEYDVFVSGADIMRRTSSLYKGMLGANARVYEPLRTRPVYIMLRLFRADVFKNIWTERFDIAGSLIYSPFDTTFAWNTSIDWVSKRFAKIGVAFNYFFGFEDGAFTQITNAFQLSVYASLSYFKN